MFGKDGLVTVTLVEIQSVGSDGGLSLILFEMRFEAIQVTVSEETDIALQNRPVLE